MVHSASVDRYVPSLVSAVTFVGVTQRAWMGVQSSGLTKCGSIASSERQSRPWAKSMVQYGVASGESDIAGTEHADGSAVAGDAGSW